MLLFESAPRTFDTPPIDLAYLNAAASTLEKYLPVVAKPSRMNPTVKATGQYAAGVGIAGLAALALGFGLLHLAFAVPQAVLPTLAGLLLAGTAVVATPAGRRVVESRTNRTASWRTVGAAVGTAALLCALYLGVTLALT